MTQVPVKLPPWSVAVVVVLGTAVLCQTLPVEWQLWLRYERGPVNAGQVWRLLTANVIHLGWPHLVLNGAGMVLLSWIFGRDWPAFRWVLALLIAGVISSAGVHLGSPEVFWLVGLSGALHGLFAFGAVGWILMDERVGWLLLVGLASKLVYEQFTGGIAINEAIVGGPIVTDAHVWGSLGGLVAAGLDKLCWRKGPAPL